MSGNPKVSVIIPVYNVELYLHDCLESIVNQTFKDIEIICINDGSTDQSAQILESYGKKDSRIKILSQANQGPSAARNAGIGIAKGEYLHFMDSDDMLELDALDFLYSKAKSEDLDVIYFNPRPICDTEELKEIFNGYKNHYKRKNVYENAVSGEKLFVAMVINNDYLVQPCLQLIRHEHIKKNNLRFYPGTYHADRLFNLTCMTLAGKVRHVNMEFFIRRIRKDSIVTMPKNFKHFYGCLMNCINMVKFLSSNKSFEQDTITQIKNEINFCGSCAADLLLKLPEKEKEHLSSLSKLEYLYYVTYIKPICEKRKEFKRYG